MTLTHPAIIMSMKADMTAVLIPVQNNLIEQAFLTSAFLLEKSVKKISRGVVKVLKMSIIVSVSS